MRRNHQSRFLSWWFFVYAIVMMTLPEDNHIGDIDEPGKNNRLAGEAYKPLTSTFLLN
jgi:hypothetical protein